MSIQLKPKDSAETPEYSKKLGQDIPLQKGIPYYEGELSKYTSASFAPLSRLPKGRKFCCHCLAFLIDVPTEICTVHEVFEQLPEYILCHLYNVMDRTPQQIEFQLRMLDRDIDDFGTKGKLPGCNIPVITASLINELEGEKERLSNDLDFCKWWQDVKDTPLGEAVKTELINLVRQKRSGVDTDWM